LGPIDPQFPLGGRSVSARSVVEQFDQARSEILSNLSLAHVWAPILPSMGPALLVEAQNALEYSEKMVARWLEQRMFAGEPDAAGTASRVAAHFNDASTHKSHGRRIGRDEARTHGVKVDDLEADQDLQDDVLTAYHLATMMIEHSLTAKMMVSDAGRLWVRNFSTS
ncbi:MAG TPA: serine protease, partial [Armatimonadota bacterium]|nr:serine protease [Armatimonadota bacterium]